MCKNETELSIDQRFKVSLDIMPRHSAETVHTLVWSAEHENFTTSMIKTVYWSI